MSVKLITEIELDDIWSPSENLQTVKKGKAINEAQEFQLYNILGAELYAEIIEQKRTATVSAENQIVIDKSKPIIAYWAEFYALDTVFANAYNKGFNNPSSEYAAVAERNALKDQKRVASQKADVYTERLIEYLKDNKSNYPLYDNKNEPTDNLGMPGFVFPKKGSFNREKNNILNKIRDNY